jgi:hypothetical protein
LSRSTTLRAGEHWLAARLEGAWCWIANRLTGQRCLVCERRLLWHTPWQWRRCCSVPLPITITEAGRARIAEQDAAELCTELGDLDRYIA